MRAGVEHREVVIVGSGPAGSATALRLAALDPALAGEMLMLEKATHPRPKTCAGGLIPKTVRDLRGLGVELTVPNVRVDAARVWTPRGEVRVPGDDLCRVVRRDEFDAALARATRERGVELREGVHVRDLRRDGDRIRIESDAGVFSAAVVVGADGSGSLVRRRLVGDGGAVAKAVMTDVPLEAEEWDGHSGRRYEFDFRPCSSGLRGYAWAFPCLIGGRPHANVGAYGLPPTSADSLHAAMGWQVRRVGGPPGRRRWRAFPIQTYDRAARVSASRTLLVGDAAGVDPLLGEGISFSLEYGMLAARAIVEARRARRWDFEPYQRLVTVGPLGRRLRLLATAARLFYGPTGAWWFRLAHASGRAQRLALDWYNGAPALEGLGGWRLLARLGAATARGGS